MRECASDSWAALRRRAPNLRVPVLLFSVVLEETFSHSFCPLFSLWEIYFGANSCSFVRKYKKRRLMIMSVTMAFTKLAPYI